MVKVFGINVGESDLVARRFKNSFGLTFPVLRDPAAATYSNYAVSGISPYPRDCIVGPDGIVRYLHSEYDPYTMKDVINQLLLTRLDASDDRARIFEKLNLHIYPNPTNAYIKVSFTSITDSYHRISVYDLTGQKIYSQNISVNTSGEKKEYWIKLLNQPSGVYYVTVSSASVMESRKIILVK